MTSIAATSPFSAVRAGWLAPAAWMLGVGGLCLLQALIAPQDAANAAALAALAIVPAAMTIAARMSGSDARADLPLTLSWTVMALIVVVMSGGSPGAFSLFALAPVFAATSGRRRTIAEAGALSLAGLAGAGAVVWAGLAGAPSLQAAPLALGLACAGLACLTIALALWTQRADEAAPVPVSLESNRLATLEALLGELEVGIVKLDADGRVLFASPPAINLLGPKWFQSEPPKLRVCFAEARDRSAFTAAMDRAVSHGQIERLEVAGRRGRTLEVVISPRAGGVSVSLADVSLRARREAAAIEERDRAYAANEAKSRFLAGMSHEIRTPLNAVIGFSDVMKQRLFGPMPAKYAEYADLIHESGTHLLDLVGDVLDMSKIEAQRYDLRIERFDARDMVLAASKLVRLRAQEIGVELIIDPGVSPLIVEADAKAVRQILLNLLSNALKFTPKGGRVELQASAASGDLVLTVRDSGAGMSDEELAQIGRPYQQAESAAGSQERGTGLGLTVVASLIELHSGEFEIDSQKGRGTIARVRLPVLASTRRADDVAPPLDGEGRKDARAQLREVEARTQDIGKTLAKAQ